MRSLATRRRVLLALGGLSVAAAALRLTAGGAGAQTARRPAAVTAPANGTLTYRITRAGLDLGRQSMVFREVEGATQVEIVTHVQVNVGGMQVYEFAQNARELWRDRRMVEFHAHANDNGARHTVELTPDSTAGAGRALLTVDGQRRQVPAEVVSSSLWHPFMLKQRLVVDSLHGDLRAFKVRDEGEVSLRVGEKDVVAKLYNLSGDLKRRLWYAQDGDRLLRMAMVARDGSEVMFDLVR